MTPIERAETALNSRIERIQINLREARSENARQFLFQSLVVCLGLAEALTDYVRTIGQYAQGRHAELKQVHDTLTAEHAATLETGKGLLEQLKASPTDNTLRKQIEQAQQKMAGIQKTLRRGANSLQRELATPMAMIDKLAVGVRRFGEADQADALKRAIKLVLEQVYELYRAQPTLPAKNIVDVAAWEKSALNTIDEATDFHEAYARAGYQTMLAIDVMALAVSPTPPASNEDATRRASESIAARLKKVTARLTNA